MVWFVQKWKEKRGYGNTKQLWDEFSDFNFFGIAAFLSRFELRYPCRNNFTLNNNASIV